MGPFWRISNRCDLEGIGGEKTDGRWHTASRGKRIVYLSEHAAVALIEVLANLHGNAKLLPDSYQLMKVVAAEIATEEIPAGALASGWRDDLTRTQILGNSWLARGESALLRVPSVPSPESLNYLLNPLHVDAKKLKIEWCKWIKYDHRLFRV